MTDGQHSESIVIHAPIDKVWDWLVRQGQVHPHFFNGRLDAEAMKPGEPMCMRSPDGKYTSITGHIVTYQPPHTFSHTLRFTSLDEPACQVDFHLSELADGTRFELACQHIPIGTQTERYLEQGAEFILHTLKGCAEQGKPPFKFQMMLWLMSLLSFTTPKRCRSEFWPLASPTDESATKQG